MKFNFGNYLFTAATSAVFLLFNAVLASELTKSEEAPSSQDAASLTFAVNLVNEKGVGQEIGTVTAQDTDFGLLLKPDLSNLPSGVHGFHLHENPDCSPGEKEGKIVPALAAGGHFDPEETESHQGPYGEGHLGDLPVLIVDELGISTLPIVAPRLTTADLKGHAVIIHAGGDNYSDKPSKLGGGGSRLACGVIK